LESFTPKQAAFLFGGESVDMDDWDDWDDEEREEFWEDVDEYERDYGMDRREAFAAAASDKAKEEYKWAQEQFLKSDEWRKLRYKILLRGGGKCQLCGRTAHDGVKLHVDHIIPLSRDWSRRLDPNNLQILCEDCNIGKGNQDSTDWREPAGEKLF
jgi:5-methylcytosine-specific restriction endonuclease McrA